MDVVVTAVLGVLVLYLFGGLKVLREYERAVYFFLGRSWGAKGPGLIYVPPLFAKTQTVSLRVVAMDIPPQDVITRDNISIKVNAVLYMLVRDPVKAVIGVENYLYATSQLAQTTLRSVLGETELDELLMNREKINNILKNIIDKRTENWGIEVTAVEVKDVDLPPEMKRAMARQAEAERERRAKVINAAGDLQAAEHDIGEGLTKAELLALGQDVGIPERYLHQALLEEQTRAVVEQGRGALAWLAGPARLSAARIAPGDRAAILKALGAWMEDEELLQVKRRHADRTSWEPKVGAFASIERALGTKGKTYALARAAEVAGQVTQLEPGFCHVQLVANVANLRKARLSGAGVLAALAAAAVALGATVPIALISPILFVKGAALGIAAILVARRHRPQNERIQVGLEQVLDRLERGERRRSPGLWRR